MHDLTLAHHCSLIDSDHCRLGTPHKSEYYSIQASQLGHCQTH